MWYFADFSLGSYRLQPDQQKSTKIKKKIAHVKENHLNQLHAESMQGIVLEIRFQRCHITGTENTSTVNIHSQQIVGGRPDVPGSHVLPFDTPSSQHYCDIISVPLHIIFYFPFVLILVKNMWN